MSAKGGKKKLLALSLADRHLRWSEVVSVTLVKAIYSLVTAPLMLRSAEVHRDFRATDAAFKNMLFFFPRTCRHFSTKHVNHISVHIKAEEEDCRQNTKNLQLFIPMMAFLTLVQSLLPLCFMSVFAVVSTVKLFFYSFHRNYHGLSISFSSQLPAGQDWNLSWF